MPAADLATLFDFETQIENAVVAALTAATVTAYRQRSTSNKATPFVSVQFSQGATIGRHKSHASALREDAFEGELTLTVVTHRDATSDSHPSYRGKVRQAMSEWQDLANGINDRLSYLQLMDCATAGAAVTTDSEEDHDVTILRYRAPFHIKADAWPA